MMQSIRLAVQERRGSLSSRSIMPPPPNLGQDLRRLGLEYTGADMSLSALFLHELHHQRSSAGHHTAYPTSTSRGERRAFEELHEDEENIPLVEQI